MVEMSDIQAFAQRVAQQFNPNRVILFGSYAWGEPTPDSDVDMLVVLDCECKGWQMAAAIRQSIRPGFPLDLLVRTPEQVRSRLEAGDGFLEEVTRRGKVLYAA